MLATFMEVLDTAIASVALPYIAGSLSASTDEATWVLTSYLVANAIVLPASNWLAMRIGRKRFFIICVAIFTASSFACGAAPTLGFILLARVLQGAGGGALQPLSQSILLESFPPEKRGVAMSVFGFGVVCAPVLGPTLGGWLTDAYSWRYAFYINIPIGILAILMIARFVQDPPNMRGSKSVGFDGIGLGTLVVWIGCLQIILDKGQEDDWFGATWIRWAALLLVVSFAWFVWHSWRAEHPLVNLRVLKNWNFTVGCLLILMFGISIYSTVTVLPLFYQELLGYTAFTAGIVVAPRGLGSIVAMPVIAYLRTDRRAIFAHVRLCTLRCDHAVHGQRDHRDQPLDATGSLAAFDLLSRARIRANLGANSVLIRTRADFSSMDRRVLFGYSRTSPGQSAVRQAVLTPRGC
jgi:DHA2 family multidrug resistance protein